MTTPSLDFRTMTWFKGTGVSCLREVTAPPLCPGVSTSFRYLVDREPRSTHTPGMDSPVSPAGRGVRKSQRCKSWGSVFEGEGPVGSRCRLLDGYCPEGYTTTACHC